jgi:predicted unusual protein kinase regulating ubiquinone biosynthesis (AarF/ABC1/UbiB family)
MQITRKIKITMRLFQILSLITIETIKYFFYGKIDYTNIIHKLSTINVLCVKVFQCIALDNNLICNSLNKELLNFTDKAPFAQQDIDIETLKKISNEQNLIIENIATPINSGMISLVFKAHEKENIQKCYAIKLKRKNIEEKLNESIDVILCIVNFLSYFTFFKIFQIKEIVNENINLLKDQLNFEKESNNILLFKNKCSSLKYVIIPNVDIEVTKKYPNVILMEYINGVSIDKVKQDDYEVFVKQIIKFTLITSFIYSIAHADLHCGNILFIKDEADVKYKHKVAILDFGIIFTLDAYITSVFIELITSLFKMDSKVFAETVIRNKIVEIDCDLSHLSEKDYNFLLCFIANFAEQYLTNYKMGHNKLEVYGIICELNNYIKNNENMTKYKIRASDTLIKLQMVCAMSQGVHTKLCGKDCYNITDSVINEVFHTDLFLSDDENH